MFAVDRAAEDHWRLTAAALGLPLWVLRLLPRRLLHRLLLTLKARAERRWFALEQRANVLDRERQRASLALDATIAAVDAFEEGRLP